MGENRFCFSRKEIIDDLERLQPTTMVEIDLVTLF